MKLFCSYSDCILQVLRGISMRHQDKKRFLDVGCGDGTRTVLFAESGRKVSGVDRMDWLVSSVRAGIGFTQADFVAKGLPFPDGAFDMIFCFDVVEHLPDPAVMLREAHRVLAGDGVFVVGTPNRHRLPGFLLVLFGLRKFPWYPGPANREVDPYCGHVREYTTAELATLLQGQNFQVARTHRVFYGMGRYGTGSFFSMPFFHSIVMECEKVDKGLNAEKKE